MVLAPLTAAVILVYREERSAGVAALLKRALDYRRIRPAIWYVPTLLLMPGIMLVAFLCMRLVGIALPPIRFAPIAALGALMVFWLAGASEELGWSGYAIDPLRQRWSALGASLILGSVWAAWHFIPLTQAGRAPPWIAVWTILTIAVRVLYVWLYNSTGKSVFAVALCHAMENFSSYVIPFTGATYDPRFTAPITALVAAIVTLWWRSTASRHHVSVR